MFLRWAAYLRETSLRPELEAELPFSETFSTHEYDRNESSNVDEIIVIPDSYNDNNDLFVRDNGDNDPVINTLTDDDAQSVHTVFSKFTDLFFGCPKRLRIKEECKRLPFSFSTIFGGGTSVTFASSITFDPSIVTA